MSMRWAALAGAGLRAACCPATGNVERNAPRPEHDRGHRRGIVGNNVGAGDAGPRGASGRRWRRRGRRGARLQQDGACGTPVSLRQQYYDARSAVITNFDQRTSGYYWEDRNAPH